MSDQIESTAEQAPQLNLSDLVAVLQILQTVVDRGAFKEEEIPTVGVLYKRVFAFLEAAGAVSQVQSPDSESTEGNQS